MTGNIRPSDLAFTAHGGCRPDCTVCGSDFRFTLLSERLIRLEFAPDGVFEDRPSQTVLNRMFDKPDFTVFDTPELLEISTTAFHLSYNRRGFTPENLVIDAKNRYTNYGARWRFGQTGYGNPPRHHNLYGTARTLDKADGAVELPFGLADRSGRSFLDDSATLLLDADGWVAPRRPGTTDVYFFCYGHDYMGALRDFWRLSGIPPMIPRRALGNWWSRYWKYSEESYNALLDRFGKSDIPFSVAVLDMDWHLTDIPEKYGRGWTGFTWNRALFPEPERFLDGLHGRGMSAVLNLHPADGVQAYEDAYARVAAALGIDAASEKPVLFDFTSKKFIDAYFDCLLHPNEKLGVDFWWIDWQQGNSCGIPGLDPMWMLNHRHYLDSCRGGRRGMILSRFCGYGSQRYPAGFSGDTVTSWRSLAFQPYFTATALNAGFPWWTHDIGGFKTGIRDSELFLRWLQFGVFSVFNRLHSSNSPFTSKDPQSFGEAEEEINRWLRFRYELIPYIYSAVADMHNKLAPVISPLYYRFPDDSQSYNSPNQYFFGEKLLVCPICTPADRVSGMGHVGVYIPAGLWTDFFTGQHYEGPMPAVLSRPVSLMPVLAAPGAIVPLAVRDAGSNSTALPERLNMLVFPGGEGSYELYEDDGGDENAVTRFAIERSDGGCSLTVRQPDGGCAAILPPRRTFSIGFRGFCRFSPVCGLPDCTAEYDEKTRTQWIHLPPVSSGTSFRIDMPGACAAAHTDTRERVFDFLNGTRMEIETKTALWSLVKKDMPAEKLALALRAAVREPENTSGTPQSDSRNGIQAVTDVLLELLYS